MKSTTDAEVVAADNKMVLILWTKLFIEAHGYDVIENVLYQDNKNAILLETNRRKNTGKKSRALNVCYFFITDQVEQGNLSIEYCPTDDMLGDYMTKATQGTKFTGFRKEIMGL